MELDMQQLGPNRPKDPWAALGQQLGQLAVSMADDAGGAYELLTQQRLVGFAATRIPGAEHASVTQIQGNRPPRTTASSHQLPYDCDQLQYQCGEGPCLEAIATDSVVLVQDLATDTRWPQFARVTLAQTPTRSMLSLRLFLTGDTQAGLNLYSTKPGAFADQSTTTASMFSAYASMALIAADRYVDAQHLARALESSRTIGMAMGILMAGGPLTSEQAFDQLRTTSQNLNRKLHEVAAEVTLASELPRVVLTSAKHRRSDHLMGVRRHDARSG